MSTAATTKPRGTRRTREEEEDEAFWQAQRRESAAAARRLAEFAADAVRPGRRWLLSDSQGRWLCLLDTTGQPLDLDRVRAAASGVEGTPVLATASADGETPATAIVFGVSCAAAADLLAAVEPAFGGPIRCAF